jgi:hypothetical protein
MRLCDRERSVAGSNPVIAKPEGLWQSRKIGKTGLPRRYTPRNDIFGSGLSGLG